MAEGTCAVPECDRDVYCKGHCRRHYRRLWEFGDPLGSKPRRARGTCSVTGCDKPHQGNGYCQMHNTRYRKTGDPGPAEPLVSNAHTRVTPWTCSHPGCPLLTTSGPLCNLHGTGWTERLIVPELGPCWEWNGDIDRRGYGTMRLPRESASVGAHRAAYRAAKGPIAPNMYVRHRCDHRPCVNPDHLLQGTHRDNMRDAVERNRTTHGERSHWHKLTEAEVLAARQQYAQGGVHHEDLAEQYHVTRRTMSRALTGDTWARAGGPLARHLDKPRGEDHSKARLDEQKVREMRKKYAVGGIIARELAAEYDVATPTVLAVLSRRTWKHVQ